MQQTAGAQPGMATATASQQMAATAEETLVARIALYPDDLVAIILPASTRPLDIVEADRFLERRKKDPKIPVPDGWDDSVKSLLNYPVVITSMSQDLSWTKALGDAVTEDQQAMLAAVQSYRRKVNAAGNLKSDGKQNVIVEKEVIQIVQADPQVIYVPQYDPVTVTSYGYSGWGYYGSPYPVYYYPYAPGAALAAGIIWGAAIGSVWNGGRYVSHYGGGNNNISIDRGDINIGGGDRNVDRGARAESRPTQGDRGQGSRGGASAGTSDARRGSGGQSTAWSPGASQTSSKVGNRVGDSQVSNRAGGSSGMGPSASNRASGSSSMGPPASSRSGGSGSGYSSGRDRSSYSGASARSSQSGGASAFSGYGSRSSASMSSSRGSMSRGGGGGRRR